MNAPRTRVRKRRPVHGVLLLDKPLGLSSNDALQKAKRLLRAEKAGHTGTLDPLATGLLPLCFGAATKFARYSSMPTRPMKPRSTSACATDDRRHRRRSDRHGATCRRHAASALEAVLAQFTGADRAGAADALGAQAATARPLYEYARAGIEVEREARTVDDPRARHCVDSYEAPLLKLRRAAAARAPTSARWAKTSARRSAAARTCGAAPHRQRRRSTLAQCVHARRELEALDEIERDGAAAAGRRAAVAGHAPRHARRRRCRPLPHGPAPPLATGADAPSACAVYGTSRAPSSAPPTSKAGELIPGRLLSPIEIQQTAFEAMTEP